MKKFKTLVAFTDEVPTNEDFETVERKNNVTFLKVSHGLYVTQSKIDQTTQAIYGTLQLSMYEAIVSVLTAQTADFYTNNYFN